MDAPVRLAGVWRGGRGGGLALREARTSLQYDLKLHRPTRPQILAAFLTGKENQGDSYHRDCPEGGGGFGFHVCLWFAS